MFTWTISCDPFQIPLAEVENVRDMQSSEDNDMQKASLCADKVVKISYFQKNQDFSNAIMINTVPEGHNSGRTYYFQASSKQECLNLVISLKKLSERERERVAAQTRFAKLQLRARKVFSSQWFQSGSATLIMAVGHIVALREAWRRLIPSADRTSLSASLTHSTAAG